MTRVADDFGKLTFNQQAMAKYLSRDVYQALKNTQDKHLPLPKHLANAVAHGMKEWAIEMDVTHFTHWFQPMTGRTAEKHDAFLDFDSEGRAIERFSGNQLIQGEPDASSFPSGGRRSTFEARGYTLWDPSSPVFIMKNKMGGTLCIPSVFLAYSGEPLDKKTPLLRSTRAVNEASQRMLGLFGESSERVMVTVGVEQEFFLLDKELVENREDILRTGRTLQGAMDIKGQKLENHYFGSIPQRVLNYLLEVEQRLFELGVPIKTRHNEVAPNQFEVAPIFVECNVAADHNHLIMEMLQQMADEHGFVCNLHEKPFVGINGSGKHINWSVATSEGENLFEPGDEPGKNIRFLTYVACALSSVKSGGGILRGTVASAENDHRLGANEAPPAVMSVFVGEQLDKILTSLIDGTVQIDSENKELDLKIAQLPKVSQDATDRNRTSPFAFTGNKFEFRAPGSNQSVAMPITVINALFANALNTFADKVEALVAGGKKTNTAIATVLTELVKESMPVVFGGNNYSEEWLSEAESRGLVNLKHTAEALRYMGIEKNFDFLMKAGVFTKSEWESRVHILVERYAKTTMIEVETLLSMVHKDILPLSGALPLI